MSNFLSFLIFSEFLFEIGEFRLKKALKNSDDKTKSETRFKENACFMVESFLRMAQMLEKQEITSIRNTTGSILKYVATGSVSKRYRTNLLAQLSKTSLENVNFDFICPIYKFQKPPSKITRYGVWSTPSKGRCFELLRGLDWCIFLTTAKLGVQ